MIPVYENPIDTTEQMFQNGKTPIISLEGSFYKEFLQGSPNIWEQKAGSLSYTPWGPP